MDTIDTSLRVQFGEFELDEADARLTRTGRPVDLAPKAFAVLCALARQPGQLMTKSALLDAVWGHQHVSESVLKTVISELRDALSDDAKQPRYIETASRRGYRFIAAASPLSRRGVPAAASPPSAAIFDAPALQRQAPAIIGRQNALAQLRAAWGDANAGQRKIFWIAGEAGIGKTTLIDSFVAGLGPVVCAYGQCVEQHGASEPYLPVLEALGALCRHDPALPAMLRAVAPTWFLQLPWLSSEIEREGLRRELVGIGQERMLRELGEFLEQYTRERPLLLVTEDLHWSDRATVHLLNHIARRRQPARLMWLASFRLADVIAGEYPLKTLRHELKLHRLCEEIVLDSFSEREVADYLDGRFPKREVPEAFVRALHARTDGLPLFVVNVIDELVSQGVLQADAAATIIEAPMDQLQVPESLAGIIEKQIAWLAPEECTLLEAASVCGVEFRAAALGDALDRDARAIIETCDDLARRQHWLSGPVIDRLPDGTPDARYTFRHALYRHVFYQRLGAMNRAELHGRIAASMERSRRAGVTVAAAELAMHYESSHALFPALRYYAEAADTAMRRFTPKQALDLTMRALTLLPSLPADRSRDALELSLSALRGVSSAQALGIRSPEAKRALRRAQALLVEFPEHRLRGLVVNALGSVLLVRAEYSEARALGEELIARSDSEGDRILSLVASNLIGQIHTLQGQYREAVEWLERGISDCEAVGDDTLRANFFVDPLVTMKSAIAIPLLHVGRVEQARAHLDTALERARRVRQPMAQMAAHWFGGLFAIRLQDIAQVAARADALRAMADGEGIAQARAPSEWFGGWAEARQGKPREASQRICNAFEDNTVGGVYSSAAEVLCFAAEALANSEDWSEAQVRLEEAIRLAERLGERVYLTQMLLLKARIAQAQGGDGAAMEAALQEARDQQSIWLELTVRVAQCELSAGARKDIDTLKETRKQLSEGSDTALVKRADELLRASRTTRRPKPR